MEITIHPSNHQSCLPVDPFGSPRRWKCADCGLVANSLSDLLISSCSSPRKSKKQLDDALLSALEGTGS